MEILNRILSFIKRFFSKEDDYEDAMWASYIPEQRDE